MSTDLTGAKVSSRTPEKENTGGCVNCSRPVTFDNFVQCDQCDSWWHMRCAGVTESVAERPWTCRNCLPTSIISRSSTRSARIALKLQKLEEERAIQQRAAEAEKRAIEQEKKAIEQEKKHVQEKYTLLEEQLEEERDTISHHSRISRRKSVHRVTQWVDQQPLDTSPGDEAAGVYHELVLLWRRLSIVGFYIKKNIP